MALEIIQTCDNCGRYRKLENIEDAHEEGWDGLYQDERAAYFCPSCIRSIIDRALEKKEAQGGTHRG